MPTYNFIDRTGEKHGRLTVVSRSTKHKRTYWDCICQCGNDTTVRGDHLKEGRVTSCGCCSEEAHTKHGLSRSPEYGVWQGIKERCENPNNPAYNNYGGRGINVCKSWSESFKAFFEDMGKRPAGYTIERIDNDAGYHKENCKWASRADQVKNRRNNITLTIKDETLCLKDWCRKLNVPYSTARYRLSRGKSIEEALGIC